MDHSKFLLSGGRACNKMYFVDLEMTGLDHTRHSILEVAFVVTDPELNVLDKYEAVIHHTEAQLKDTSGWCRKKFANTLFKECLRSAKTLQTVENELAEFLDRHRNGLKVILAGSSVSTDRMFIQYSMPRLASTRIHYRIIDISTVMELAKKWAPAVYQGVDLRPTVHRALGDAMASYGILKHYKEHFFNTEQVEVKNNETASQETRNNEWQVGQLYTSEHAGWT